MFRLHYRKPGAATWFHTPTVHASHGAAIRESADYCAAGFTEVKVLEAESTFVAEWDARIGDLKKQLQLKEAAPSSKALFDKADALDAKIRILKDESAAASRKYSDVLNGIVKKFGDFSKADAKANAEKDKAYKAVELASAAWKKANEELKAIEKAAVAAEEREMGGRMRKGMAKTEAVDDSKKATARQQAEREVADLQAKIKTAAAARDKAKQARERFDAAEEKPIRDKVISLRSELAAADALFKKLQYKAADLATEWRQADNECAALEKELAKAQKKLK